MSSEFTKFLSWDSFYDTIENGFKTLTMPQLNNSSFFNDVIAFHGHTDTLVYALISGIFFAFLSWILSLLTGLHTWVRIELYLQRVTVLRFTQEFYITKGGQMVVYSSCDTSPSFLNPR